MLQFGDTLDSLHLIRRYRGSMEMSLQDVKNHLMATDAEFSRLAREHSDYEHRLQELSSRPYLSDAEQVQEVDLKKRKLSLKDQMERIIQRYKREGIPA
jgi:uncharacterized protein YdcH (DUF465 family)